MNSPLDGDGWFAVDVLEETPLAGGRILLRNPFNGAEMALPEEVVNALSYCDTFRSLEGHAGHLAEGNPTALPQIRSLVQAVHDAGLTLSASDICARFAAEAPLSPPVPKPVVAILTWERPDSLRRLLASLVEYSDLSRIDSIFVIDDSRRDSSRSHNREITGQAGEVSGFAMQYFGANEAGEMLDGLLERLPERQNTLRFLIDRERWSGQWTAGITRNFSLMLSVGRPVIVIDDDVLCRAFRPPLEKSGIEISDRQRDVMVFGSNADWEHLADLQDPDPIARHMQCLGLTLPQALASLGVARFGERQLRHTPSSLARRLSPSSRVLSTQCGSLGDPGTAHNRWWATVKSSCRARLQQTPGGLERALNGRNWWLGRQRPVIEALPTMSQITGLDNREHLPPYFPINRNQDLIFGEVLSFVFGNSVSLDGGWAVPHLPIPERQWSCRDSEFFIRPRYMDLLADLVTERLPKWQQTTPSSNMQDLAASLIEFSQSPEETWLTRIEAVWNRRHQQELDGLELSLAESGAALPGWREYLCKAIEQLQSVTFENRKAIQAAAEDRQAGDSGDDTFWRNLISGFGQSLQAWPEIREASADHVRMTF